MFAAYATYALRIFRKCHLPNARDYTQIHTFDMHVCVWVCLFLGLIVVYLTCLLKLPKIDISYEESNDNL